MAEETGLPETEDNSKEDGQTGAELGGIGGAVAGAVAGSMAGPIGTIAGALIGGIVGAVTSKAVVGVLDRVEHDHSVTAPEEPTTSLPAPAETQEHADGAPTAREDV